jgi:hypothetical protein
VFIDGCCCCCLIKDRQQTDRHTYTLQKKAFLTITILYLKCDNLSRSSILIVVVVVVVVVSLNN